MIGRLVRAEDFQRVLRTQARARSEHFAIHHLPACPSRARQRAASSVTTELSTAIAPGPDNSVDDSLETGCGRWLGLVVPKRHARRSVTRTLLKRQIRSAVGRSAAELDAGLWVVRLRTPFDPVRFVSAASPRLAAAAASELAVLLGAVRRPLTLSA